MISDVLARYAYLTVGVNLSSDKDPSKLSTES
jgi:hypothetical protein